MLFSPFRPYVYQQSLMQRLRLIATCCLCFCCSSCAVHLTALGAARAVAGLLQLSPCTQGLTADADAMAAIVAALRLFFTSLEDRNAALSLHPHRHAVGRQPCMHASLFWLY